jgi:hypothetical protein
LFDLLLTYANDRATGRIKPTRSLASTSPALTFCENFYAQFFQNELGQEITTFNQQTKTAAVRLRLQLKKKRTPKSTIELVTWFEKLCDIYPNVLALAYGGGSRITFVDFHANYLITPLVRGAAWAKAKKYPDVAKKARLALAALKKGLAALPK